MLFREIGVGRPVDQLLEAFYNGCADGGEPGPGLCFYAVSLSSRQ